MCFDPAVQHTHARTHTHHPTLTYTHSSLCECVEDFGLLSDQCSAFFPQQRCPLSGPLIDLLRTDASRGFFHLGRQQGTQGLGHVTGSVTPEIRTTLVIHLGQLFQLQQLRAGKKNNKAPLIFICYVIGIHRQIHDAEHHLALRLLFQPKGWKHLIPAAQVFLYHQRKL